MGCLLDGGAYDSTAEHLCALGNIVVLPDHLGISDSSRAPEQMKVTRQVAALANHAAMIEIYDRLRRGTLHSSLPALPDFLKVGGGHSMGGMQTITQQAEYKTFDRICVLGYTAIGVHLHVNGQVVSADPGPLDYSQPNYWSLDRSQVHKSFHWDDVPADVIAYDDTLLVEVPYVLSKQSVTTGIVSEDAARIDVPIYICLGERDVSPNPHAEPSYYKNSHDVTLHILPKSGHCQSFASTRKIMFDRIDAWIRSIPQ
jgi:pimeloyl-ACP methyl ester carboxylesterase